MATTSIKPHRFPNLFIFTSTTPFIESLCTVNLCPNLTSEEHFDFDEIHIVNEIEYRVWNPFQCFLAAAILGGISNINIKAGCRVLCIGCSPITVSALSDLVSDSGRVYSVNSASGVSFDWTKMQGQRSNLICISGNSMKPSEYESIIGEKVDVIVIDGFVKVLEWNAELFLKEGGHFLIATRKPEGSTAVLSDSIVQDIRKNFKPREMLTLEPFFQDWSVLGGSKPVKSIIVPPTYSELEELTKNQKNEIQLLKEKIVSLEEELENFK